MEKYANILVSEIRQYIANQDVKLYIAVAKKIASSIGISTRDFMASDIERAKDGRVRVTIRSGPEKGRVVQVPEVTAEEIKNKFYVDSLQDLLDAHHSTATKLVLDAEMDAA